MSAVLSRRAEQYLYNRASRLSTGSLPDFLLFGALRTLSALPPLHARIQRIGGRIHLLRGDHAEAERWLLASLDAGRHNTAGHYNVLGRTQVLLGKFHEAEKNLQAAIEHSRTNDGYYLHMAGLLRQQGRLADAEPYLRRALELKPHSAWNHFCLFENNRARLGDEAALDTWLEDALANPEMEDPIIHPDWWLVHKNAYSPGRVEKARALLAQHPEAPDCHLLLAYLLRYSDNPAEGLAHLQFASRRNWESSADLGPPADARVAKDPAFLVVGVAKSGSTALYKYLGMHPLIASALAKEINYWTDHYAAGRDWYRAFFPPIPAAAPQISGEATIKTFWDPAAPERIARDFPDMKLILILREPVARAFSEYNMFVRLGREQRSWEECVAEQLANLPRCPVNAGELSSARVAERNFLEKGAVLPVLKHWLESHDKDKLLVLQNSDLDRDTTATMNRVFAFLGLPGHDIVAPPRMNVGVYKPMPDDMNRRLQAWYRPHQEALAEFLAREFP